MAGQVSQDPPGSDEPHEETASGEFGNAGTGAASALEQMKSQRERRQRRLHGSGQAWPERDDDARRERQDGADAALINRRGAGPA